MVESHSTKTSSTEHEGEEGDVTFVVSAGNATAAPDTSASAQQAGLDSQVVAGSNINNDQGDGDAGLEHGQSCDHVGKEQVELK